MIYAVVCAVALVASGLTLFSGFGLGTILMPAFAVFFPVAVAVALTSVVHLLNNLFKLALLGRHADTGVVLRFGVPALVTALVGAWLLQWLSGLAPLVEYTLAGRACAVHPVKLAVAAIMAVFAVLEGCSVLDRWSVPPRWLPVGGALSGFLGGLSGHQGALRSVFLLRCNLSKEAFLATGVVIACIVDVGRIAIYAATLPWTALGANAGLLAAATAAAFAGAFAGARLVRKITLRTVQGVVAILLFVLSVALGAGLV